MFSEAFWAADVAAPMRKEWLEKFLAEMPADSRTALDVFGTRCDWLVSRHGLKIRVRGGSSLENGLVRLERRRKIKNVNEVTFLDLVCLTLFAQKGDGFAIEDS